MHLILFMTPDLFSGGVGLFTLVRILPKVSIVLNTAQTLYKLYYRGLDTNMVSIAGNIIALVIGDSLRQCRGTPIVLKES